MMFHFPILNETIRVGSANGYAAEQGVRVQSIYEQIMRSTPFVTPQGLTCRAFTYHGDDVVAFMSGKSWIIVAERRNGDD